VGEECEVCTCPAEGSHKKTEPRNNQPKRKQQRVSTKQWGRLGKEFFGRGRETGGVCLGELWGRKVRAKGEKDTERKDSRNTDCLKKTPEDAENLLGEEGAVPSF